MSFPYKIHTHIRINHGVISLNLNLVALHFKKFTYLIANHETC